MMHMFEFDFIFYTNVHVIAHFGGLSVVIVLHVCACVTFNVLDLPAGFGGYYERSCGEGCRCCL